MRSQFDVGIPLPEKLIYGADGFCREAGEAVTFPASLTSTFNLIVVVVLMGP